MSPGAAHTQQHAAPTVRGAAGADPGWPALAALAAIAAALILWFGRDASFSLDELVWVVGSPDLDAGDALDPYSGHLIFTTRVVYKLILSTFGPDYLAFRLLTLFTVVICAALMFAYARRLIGSAAALVPAAFVLMLGRDWGHLVQGNGFTVVGATACGLGALLALERDDRLGEFAACALLVLGVATYSVALPFVVGVAVVVLMREDRWRRIWIPAVPALLYLAWWIGAHGSHDSSSSEVVIENLLLLPAWSYQALSAVLAALSGLDYELSTQSSGIGPLLAILALAGLGWRIRRGSVPAALWAAIAMLLALWALEAVVANPFRTPQSSRYLMPTAALLFVAGAWAITRVGWTRERLLALYAVAAIGLIAGVFELRDGGRFLRDQAEGTRTELGAIDLAASSLVPGAAIPGGEERPAGLPFDLPSDSGQAPVASYLDVSTSYGPMGFSADQIRSGDEARRALAESVLVAVLGLALKPAANAAAGPGCRAVDGPESPVRVAPGSRLAISAGAAPVDVSARRFADLTSTAVGTVGPGDEAALEIPPDAEQDPWAVSLSAPARACVS